LKESNQGLNGTLVIALRNQLLYHKIKTHAPKLLLVPHEEDDNRNSPKDNKGALAACIIAYYFFFLNKL
jgi:hypothetical protein